MNTLAEFWEDYRKNVTADGVPPEIISLMKSCFGAGALACCLLHRSAGSIEEMKAIMEEAQDANKWLDD